MYSPKKPKRKDAFTLVEVMVAMTIFALVIFSGFACLKMGLGLTENSRHNTRAAQIMQSEIERVRSLAWALITTLPATDADVAVAAHFNQSIYDAYTMSRTVTGSGDIRVITLDITWTDQSGNAHSRTYASQYTKGGLYDYIQ